MNANSSRKPIVINVNDDYDYNAPIHPLVQLVGIVVVVVTLSVGAAIAFTPWFEFFLKEMGI
jgi:hypothetical protein